MARKRKNLRTMSEKEIIKGHDQVAENVDYNANDYLYELKRRHVRRQATAIFWFTLIITISTVANVALAICEALI